MKTILVATDFSNAAHDACAYAASLAQAFNARLIILSAYEPVTYPTNEIPVMAIEDTRIQTEWQLNQEQKALQQVGKDILITTICREGMAAREIADTAAEQKADVIIAGMKTKGKAIRKLFGSTITALIMKPEVPVIVVPEGATFTKLDAIALATEHDAVPDASPYLLDTLRELGERFSSRLFLIRIANNSYHQAYEVFNRPLRLMKMVHTLHPVYECVQEVDERTGLNEFVVQHHVDMLVLLPRKHSVLDRFFIRSTTRGMVFDTQIPLLILPDLHKETTT